jgi:hypothetical protein
MPVESVSAVLFYSSQPSRLADFYRNHLGIPFELDRHGSIREHLEADVGNVHLAVLKGGGGGLGGRGRFADLPRARSGSYRRDAPRRGGQSAAARP